MGIVNVTPDSFSDGGVAFDPVRAVDRALQLVEEGADIIDVGGESTRPGSDPISEFEELRRVIPVIERLSINPTICISIDTYKASVAERALAAGASIVNDISGGTFDPAMAEIVKASNAGAVLMHIKGTPRDMQKDPAYVNVVEEVGEFLAASTSRFVGAGIAADRILVDPGIGFGKRLEDNLELTRNLASLRGSAAGVLYGPSRKSFLGAITGRGVDGRAAGTLGSIAAAYHFGADVFRVHDVRETADVIKVLSALEFPRSVAVGE